MATAIGQAAGKVWTYLHANGNATSAKIAKGAKLARNEAERAIGWLAREDKLRIEKTGRTEIISLG